MLVRIGMLQTLISRRHKGAKILMLHTTMLDCTQWWWILVKSWTLYHPLKRHRLLIRTTQYLAQTISFVNLSGINLYRIDIWVALFLVVYVLRSSEWVCQTHVSKALLLLLLLLHMHRKLLFILISLAQLVPITLITCLAKTAWVLVDWVVVHHWLRQWRWCLYWSRLTRLLRLLTLLELHLLNNLLLLQ